MIREYNITPQGYYRDEIRFRFPEIAALYFVYRSVLNPIVNRVTLKELIYIGETDNLYRRFNEHERRPDFLGNLEQGEMLFYSIAEISISEAERKRVEAALIYELRPRLNVMNIMSFDYDKTVVRVSGDRHAFVPTTVIAPPY